MGFLRIDGVTRALGDKVSPLRVEALLEMFEGHVDVEMHSDWPSETVLDPVCFSLETAVYGLGLSATL